jgi:Flp pilus assembly protein CpaB
VLSASIVATAVWLTLSSFLPKPAARGIPVVVVTQDLMPGHVLTRGDLGLADWPRKLSPKGAVTDCTTLVGKSLGAGLSRGEAITPARIRGPGLLTGGRTGLVAAHVRLTDPAMAAMAAPGERVDLISSSGQVVAAAVMVLAVDAGPISGDGWAGSASEPSGGVVIAAERDDALRLAAASSSEVSDGSLTLVVRAPGV